MGFKTNHLTGKRIEIAPTSGDELTAFNIHKAELHIEAQARSVDMVAVSAQKIIDKAAGKQKLLDLGLTRAQVDALST